MVESQLCNINNKRLAIIEFSHNYQRYFYVPGSRITIKHLLRRTLIQLVGKSARPKVRKKFPLVGSLSDLPTF